MIEVLQRKVRDVMVRTEAAVELAAIEQLDDRVRNDVNRRFARLREQFGTLRRQINDGLRESVN